MQLNNILTLAKNDFKTYKRLLLDNQYRIFEKFYTEKIFISALDVESLEEKIETLSSLDINEYPLLGVPFAVKDNIDVKGFITTAGCKEFSYTPKESAFAVKLLEKAGAICIGKTNMDQFATGLVGTRSPYGVAINYYNEEYIPGGSSSGSASSLTAGYVAFSLGTDTAGSGRVPASFQNLVGIKPTRGIVSNTGLVPACKSLDCISIFANEINDGSKVLEIMAGYDEIDEYSRINKQEVETINKKIAIPMEKDLNFFRNSEFKDAFNNFVSSMITAGYTVEEIDFAPMFDAAKLLYDGPWVSERYHAVGSFIEEHQYEVFPTTRDIILGGKELLATDYFNSEYKLRAVKKVFDKYSAEYRAFIMPTVGTIYKKEELENNPIELNSNLGYYTNFMNLLDCSAIALPVAITKFNLPFGITAFSECFNDKNLIKLGEELACKGLILSNNPNPEYIDLAVCGAHKREGSLNFQLTDIDAFYKETTYTSHDYRFYALENLEPVRPGLIRVPEDGANIEVEIWKVRTDKLGGFINNIGGPLGFGKVELISGEIVTSFLCEAYALEHAKDITNLQSWEKYLETLI